MNEPIPVAAIEPNRDLRLGFGFLPRLRCAAWWNLGLQSVFELQKLIWKPALALGFAFTEPYIAFDQLLAALRSHSDAYNGLPDLLQTLGPVFLGLIVFGLAALTAAFWGLGACVVGTTALCKTFLSICPDTASTDKAELKVEIQKTLTAAIAEFKQRKPFFFAVWAMYLLFIAVPSIIMLVSGCVVVVGMPKVGDISILPGQLSVPIEIMLAAGIALSLSIIIISNYTLILMPYSSMSKQPATRVATKGLLLSIKVFLGITIYSTIVFWLSNLLIAPVDLLMLFNTDLGTNVVVRYFFFLLKVVWHAFFFAVLVPITVLIPCEMVRGNIE